MSTYTPGPWQTRFIYRTIRRVRESPGDLLIASKPENDWPDARLMAAAPTLLAACQQVVRVIEAFGELREGPTCELVKQAVARALEDGEASA